MRRKWTVRVVLVLMLLALQGPATLASAGGASIDGADHPCGYGFGGGLAVAIWDAVVD